jgi:xanthine dehydrogenase molybdopterin-binding subunit B
MSPSVITQVCGEATYTDDMRLTSDALVGVCVTSTKPHARIVSVDASEALKVGLNSAGSNQSVNQSIIIIIIIIFTLV